MLLWLSQTLRQMVIPPLDAVPQIPAGTTFGQGCGVGVMVVGAVFAGSRCADRSI